MSGDKSNELSASGRFRFKYSNGYIAKTVTGKWRQLTGDFYKLRRVYGYANIYIFFFMIENVSRKIEFSFFISDTRVENVISRNVIRKSHSTERRARGNIPPRRRRSPSKMPHIPSVILFPKSPERDSSILYI